MYFRNCAQALDYLQTQRYNRTKVDMVSHNGGCYLFYIGQDGNLHKRQVAIVGISYVASEELLEIVQQENLIKYV